MATRLNVFGIFQLASIIAPVLDEILRSAKKDSKGGKKITKAEWQKISKALVEALQDDETLEKIKTIL